MRDYSKAVIYTIKTDGGIYVGSSKNYSKRKSAHKQIVKNGWFSNRTLYRNIRKHNGNYKIEIYKLFPCNNKIELFTEEQRVFKKLNANLNTYECKNYRHDKITCECGTTVRRDNYRRHQKCDKHIQFLIDQEKENIECKECKTFLDMAGNFINEIEKENEITKIILTKKNKIIDPPKNIIIDPPPSIASDTDSDSDSDSECDSEYEININDISFNDISSNA